VCIGNANDIEYRIYDDMENVLIKDLLPTDLTFDMNMHILSFKPGGCHPFVETHVQEHGAYVLYGEGVYLLDDTWKGIKKDDFIWFGPYVAQASYGIGRDEFTYIYSKDCNRDVIL
ncbi:MAG: (S)-ureidoglycine aminohydrolase, partial [Ruminiclostridium sp.]